ncbi:dTDP-4-amino-4,6-dideoxygalactose transaminase [Desulfonauticus submarinus]|uniref:dTDP-4-amino-4,6-dideoxygalactose transaminase n=1 Tax=Desulfonauticus submarinus TaxID=206665 RepID=A0A1G9ZXR8_9BACT|nr:DegT/DnrJ/EryC1/StrS family aminotransferase [Desulfonauticus submarinus]SDN25691.1 dTDP-4-amino-4,6-dideoxygalactose transaminase [Desulfonauticus submarinus]
MSSIRSKKNFLVFGSPYIGEEEIQEVIHSLRTCWLGTGPKVAQFEKNFKQFKKIPYAIAVNSCTAALHLSLIAADIGPGDEVITTPLTFCATINAIIHAGATPVLVDVDKKTFNLNPDLIEEKITPKTKAILPVHFAGRPCEMDKILSLAKKYNLKVIEDCAHAIEAEYKNKPCGTFGDFGCFSFYVTKNIITGEGGMIITHHSQLAKRIKILALHGMSADAWRRFSDEGYKHYMVVECGYKYNMMDIQAAIGIHQLKRVNIFWKKRKKIWEIYLDAFSDLPITLPNPFPDYIKPAYHLFTILIDEKKANINRDNFLNALNKHNIGSGVHYLSIPEHPFYQQKFGWKPEDYPNAMTIGRQTLSLPLSAKLTDKDINDVILAVKTILKECKC